MHRAALAVLLVAPALGRAAPDDERDDQPARSSTRLSPSLDLLPSGSILQDVRIPRYDEKKRRAALLKADTLRVISEHRVSGTQIKLQVFNRSGQPSLWVNMQAADYFRDEGRIEARDALTVRGDGFAARGPGAVFHLNSRKAFLHGPAFTSFVRDKARRKNRPATTTKATAMRPLVRSLAAAPMLSLAASAAPPGPQPLTTTDLEKLDALSRPRAAAVLADTAPTREILTRSEQLSRAARAGLRTFARRLDNPPYLVVSTSGPPREKPSVPPRPADGIEISCEGGMFFDADKGHIVYLDSIVVIEPRFKLTAASELKVFLEKRENADEKGLEGPESFGDVKTIVATGGVTVVRHDPNDQRPPIIASADTATYDAKSGDFVLRGGFPTIRQGQSSLQAEQPGLYLRFYANGNFFAEKGRWKTIGDIARLRDQKDNP